jgi:hypothetical protein
MSNDWEVLTSNQLRCDAKYTNMAKVENDDISGSIYFSNMRTREGTTNQAPIVSFYFPRRGY